MKICFPVKKDEGLDSRVLDHFGSAKMFIIYDEDTGNLSTVSNPNQHHGHGACQPLMALSHTGIDTVILGGIGMNALHKLTASGIQVFEKTGKTIKENVAAFQNKNLKPMTAVCRGHDHQCGGGGKGHGGRGHGSGGQRGGRGGNQP